MLTTPCWVRPTSLATLDITSLELGSKTFMKIHVITRSLMKGFRTFPALSGCCSLPEGCQRYLVDVTESDLT